MPGAAHAYIDPATTTYLIQIFTALVVTIGVSLSVFLYRFRIITAKIRYGLYGFLHRRKGGRSASPNDGGGPGDGSERPTLDGGAGGESEKAARGGSGTGGGYVFPDYAIPGGTKPLTEEDMTALGEPADIARIERADKILDAPGERRYSGRLRAALPVALALCLSFIFLGCIDLGLQNATNMPFLISEAVPVIFACFAVCLAVLLFVIPLFRGRLFEILLSLAAALLIAGYIQGNFLNMGMGELTGDMIVWSVYRSMMIGSTVFWACMVAAVLMLRRYARPLWRRMTVFIPFLLIVIQCVALLSLFGADSKSASKQGGLDWGTLKETLSIDGIGELSSGKNTVFIILDRLDEEFVNEIEQEDPNFFEPLDGFTKFEDNISYYVSTFPSVTSMLTGNRFFFEGPVTPYFDYAWSHARYLDELLAHGVDIRLYMDRGHAYNHIEQLQGIASNILVPEYDFSPRIALVKFLKLSAFRYSPMPAKRVFWLSPTEFSDAIQLGAKSAPYVTNDFAFHDRLAAEGLKKTDGPPAFVFIHLLGAHDPIRMDENIQPSLDSTPVRQAMGAFRIVFEYFDRMKELGLYDDATIIITGDHGLLQGDGVVKPALTGLLIKPAGSYGTPLAYSGAPVCPQYLGATILEGMLGDAGDFGPTYFDVKEGDQVRREYITDLQHYEIIGDGRDFDNWHYLGKLENKSDW